MPDQAKTHIIRLRRPWNQAQKGGNLVLSRRFHSPTGLTPGTRVYLVAELGVQPLLTTLNGTFLSGTSTAETTPGGRRCWRWDITELLKAGGNQLEIAIDARHANPVGSPTGDRQNVEDLPGIDGEVYLEIWDNT